MKSIVLLSLLALVTDYDSLITDLAGDSSKASMAHRELMNAGIDAFPALARRMHDQTVIENGIFQEATTGKPSIGRVTLLLVRSQIEGTWGKSVRNYHALTKANAAEWVVAHIGQSIHEMRIHAISESLDSVSQDISSDGCSEQEARALRFLVERLKRTLAVNEVKQQH